MSKPPRSGLLIRRRGFLAGLAAALVVPTLATPAIIRTPGLLMPISPVKPEFTIKVGRWRWGGLDNLAIDAFNPASEEWQYVSPVLHEPLALLPPSQLWGGAEGFMAERIALVGDDPLGWQENEVRKMFAEGVFA